MYNLIGFDEKTAVDKVKSLGYDVIRVFDEERKVATMDFCENRINLYLRDGVVVMVTTG